MYRAHPTQNQLIRILVHHAILGRVGRCGEPSHPLIAHGAKLDRFVVIRCRERLAFHASCTVNTMHTTRAAVAIVAVVTAADRLVEWVVFACNEKGEENERLSATETTRFDWTCSLTCPVLRKRNRRIKI